MVEAAKKNTHGGARPGAGRPAGVPNRGSRELKELCRSFTTAAVEELARIAGVHREPVVDKEGNPILIPQFNPDGSPALDPDGRQLMGARMRRVAGSGSDTARIGAISVIFERGYGKAKQPLVGEEDEDGNNKPLNGVAVVSIELEVVPVGTPVITADNTNDHVSEEDAPAEPANDVPQVA